MNESNDCLKNSGRVSSKHCYQWQSHDWTSTANKSQCPSADEFYKLARHSNVNLLGEYQRTPVTFFGWREMGRVSSVSSVSKKFSLVRQPSLLLQNSALWQTKPFPVQQRLAQVFSNPTSEGDPSSPVFTQVSN